MVTDDQRKRARQIAEAIWNFHNERGHPDNQIATDQSGIEVLYMGKLAEFEYTNEHGGTVDDALKAGGDGGIDFKIRLEFTVNVKANSYSGPDPLLMVECSEIKPDTIYVAAYYDKAKDDVILQGWAWGASLIKENSVRRFRRDGPLNFTTLIAELRNRKFLRDHQVKETK